jgi:hypothetical protein
MLKIIALFLGMLSISVHAVTLSVVLPDSCSKPVLAVSCGDVVQPPNPPIIPPPNPPSGNACVGWNVRTIDLAYPVGGNSPRIFTDRYGSFGNTDMLVFRFRTPATDATGASLVMSEYSSYPAAFRTAALATAPCVLPPASVIASSMSQSPVFNISLKPAFGLILLAPNTTYYVNVVNQMNGQRSCPSSNCAMYVDFLN